MRKTGTGEGRHVLMNSVRSESTREVSPVRPLSAGRLTDLPHPLWSKERTSMPWEASVGKKVPYALPGSGQYAHSLFSR